MSNARPTLERLRRRGSCRAGWAKSLRMWQVVLSGGNLKKLSLSILIIAPLLSACTVPTKVLLFNASTEDIALEYVDEYQKSIIKTIRINEKAESMMLLEAAFSINRNSLVLRYSPDGFPQEFAENTGFGPFHSRIVKMQLEKDRCIYLVAKNAQYPARVHGAQPVGFPLCPTSTSR